MINTYELRKHKCMVRKTIYSIEEVLSQVDKGIVNFDGDMISMNSDRYRNFVKHGVICVDCGLTGLYFIKEKFKSDLKYHFNLYALDKNNNEILMTKDHIIPKSKGGPNHINNYQPMCSECNRKKGNQMPNSMVIEEVTMKTLNEVQNWVNNFNIEQGWNPNICSAFEMMNYLTEETGELARAIRTIEVGRKRPDETLSNEKMTENLIEEMGDVIGALAGIASHYCISLSDAFEVYKIKMSKRYPPK